MSTRKFQTSAADRDEPLGAWVSARLALPLDEARDRVTRGAVYVGGRRALDPEGFRLRGGERVVVHIVDEAAEAAESSAADASAPVSAPPLRVVVEGKGVLVIDKPSGIPSQATREASAGALDALVRARYPTARLMHRLDRAASGLVLFAQDAAARRAWQTALTRGLIDRTYVAIVSGAPSADRFTLDAPVGADPRDRRRQRVHGAGALPAVTHVEVVRRGRDATGADAAEVRVRLETGRTHQIRVHLAFAGHPILGDPLYAPADVASRAPRLALHASRLAWPGGAAESPPPPELLALLRAPLSR